jgi:hypothetical protein
MHVFMCTALLVSITLGINIIAYDMCNNFKLLISNGLARFKNSKTFFGILKKVYTMIIPYLLIYYQIHFTQNKNCQVGSVCHTIHTK